MKKSLVTKGRTKALVAIDASDHNAIHARSLALVNEGALLAILCGLALIDRRDECAHGEWGKWVEAHCQFTIRTATRHIAAAEGAIARLTAPELVLKPGEDFEYETADVNTVRERLLAALESEDHGQRSALLEAIAKPALPAPQKKEPKAVRTPRPAGPRLLTIKAAPKIVTRLRSAPAPVLDAVFSELRPVIETWLTSHPAA